MGPDHLMLIMIVLLIMMIEQKIHWQGVLIACVCTLTFFMFRLV